MSSSREYAYKLPERCLVQRSPGVWVPIWKLENGRFIKINCSVCGRSVEENCRCRL